ncbi:MAG: DUF3105 domain-containing protein [Candidatus Vogelbacteria bacterium]|nr:DUF3105 domain-containing protein [Candidatus Vogelbacteria bacterium]
MKNKWLTIIIVIILVALGGWWFVREVQERIPAVADQSTAYPELGRDHIPVGAEHPPYNSNPPSSGWHYAETAKLGFYAVDEPSPADENLIHNIEHGEIWIAYRPTIPEPIQEALKQFAAESLVIITPRSANDTDIALVAWGRVDKWDLEPAGALDEQRIRDFITRWRNRGPEKVSPAVHQSR